MPARAAPPVPVPVPVTARRPREPAVAPVSVIPRPRTAAWASAAAALAALRKRAAVCENCPLYAGATQTVFGEGPIGARLMLVGETPGDREDLEGHPFVGPAGRLLARAMAELGWERSAVYLTNAVKHFKYTLRGKRRMHKTPAQREADACLQWLEGEIALVDPQAIVALGSTASRQLLGRPVPVMRERGQWLTRPDGRRVLVTLHPSALLRGDRAEMDSAFAAWLADLRHADAALARGA
jgi:uracil-DNA glycosylase